MKALTSRTFLTVWSLFLPLSLACCSTGAWGRTMRRSVPSWAKGGTLARQRERRPQARLPPPAGRPGWRRQPRDAEPLGQGREGAGGGIPEGPECGQQCRQEEVNPAIGCALHHPEQAPLHDLERRGFQVDQDKQEPSFRCRE